MKFDHFNLKKDIKKNNINFKITQITDILRSLAIINHNDADIHLKIDHFTKITRVDKSSKYVVNGNLIFFNYLFYNCLFFSSSEFATFSISLKDLDKASLINIDKLSDEQNRIFQVNFSLLPMFFTKV